MIKKILKTLLILLVLLAIEAVVMGVWAHSKESSLRNKYKTEIDRKKIKHEMDKKKLYDEYQHKRHLATGVDVYQRIYNTKGQSLTVLVRRLAKESFPDQWKCEVEVDEFTDFLLLVQTTVKNCDKLKDNEYELPKLMEYITPVMSYTAHVLKNVCIFDIRHKCYLFFDEQALYEVYTIKELSPRTIVDIKHKGRMFTRYDSVKINFQSKYGHIFVPVVVSGASGVYECLMMLDTGASKTVISLDLAQRTGHEDLNQAKRMTFSTANGMLSCPIVERNVWAGDIGGQQTVAVNLRDNSNLLGVDFFTNKNYIIDAASNCIYVWGNR